MKAADWTYEKLAELTAQELEQLITNLETAQNRVVDFPFLATR